MTPPPPHTHTQNCECTNVSSTFLVIFTSRKCTVVHVHKAVVSFRYLFPNFSILFYKRTSGNTYSSLLTVQKVGRSLTSVCTSGKWNTDGCTYVPDLFLNFEACVMHDLCYITPGATKVGISVFIWLFKSITIP